MPSDHAVKVVYKGADSTEFFVIANADMLNKWKSDKTVPLVDVVQSFDVFTTPNKSSTGEYISPPKSVLENTFNTASIDDIVKKILSEGEDKSL